MEIVNVYYFCKKGKNFEGRNVLDFYKLCNIRCLNCLTWRLLLTEGTADFLIFFLVGIVDVDDFFVKVGLKLE